MTMAGSGSMMILFVLIHLLGNTTVFGGPDVINTYSMKLKGLGPFVWAFRLFLLAMLSLHAFVGVAITLENRSARKEPYAMKKYLASTFAGRNMIWSGLLLGTFILYHLLHFTFHVGTPGVTAHEHLDSLGRHDVFGMVVMSFRHLLIVTAYLAGLSALGLHLFHGIQSLLQTLGLNGDRSFPLVKRAGRTTAILLYVGYISIPLVIFAGILNHYMPHTH